jgi:rhamnogalacturonyl hydrolase YesR
MMTTIETPKDNAAKALPAITNSLDKVENWVEGQNYKGYEPFDGLSSWFRPLTMGNLLGERLLQQLIRQSPFNLRPLMGVTKKDSTKGRGYMAAGYVLRYRATGAQLYLDKAAACLDWLDQHKAPKFNDHSWSNHFDFSSRGGKYTRHDPIIVWTSLIGHAYLDAYDATGEKRWLQIADSACRWIMHLPREKTESGDCLSYLAFTQESIHNASMLGAGLLARAGKLLDKAEYVSVARSAMLYSCSRQLPNGAWWYAEEPKYQWVDNFHTGYNLDSLKHYIDATGDETWSKNLMDGLGFYKANFFEADGCPKYYHNRCYPIDIQCAGQSLETLSVFSELDSSCLDLAVKSALWIIENMQDGDGHFYYRIYPMIKARTAMLHWGQGTMYKGLAQLAEKLQRASSAPPGKGR